jgi:hemin uptake protein HemP
VGDEDEPRNARGGQRTGGGSREIPLRDNRIDSGDLFVGTREITIVHGDETYRLRATAQNKLIMTK